MLIVEHRFRSLEAYQSLVAEVVGPPPATHLFLCSGTIQVEASCVVQEAKWSESSSVPNDPLPLTFMLPDNQRQYLSLTARDGTPLTLLSSTASATFLEIEHSSEHSKKIAGVQVQQQGLHALLVIWLRVGATYSKEVLGYQASLLAGPVAALDRVEG